MKRLDLLATMLTLPFALLGAKNIARADGDFDGLRSGTSRNAEAGVVNALAHELRAGAGHGEHNAIVLQRAVDDAALIGGTVLIPTGYFEIASPISLAVTPGKRCKKELAIVGAEGAVLATHGDRLFAIAYSDQAQLSRVEFRGLHLQGNLREKM